MPAEPDAAGREPTGEPRETDVPDPIDGPDVPAAEVPDRVLASALEFAVGIAAAGSKLRPPLVSPPALRTFFRFQKLPANAFAKVRAAVEADADFRRRLAAAAAAAPELLDEAGMVWLARPPGWQTRLAGLVDAVGPSDLAAELRRAERRREAAEQAAHRAVAELAVARLELAQREQESQTTAAATAKLQRRLDETLASLDRVESERRRIESRLAAAEAATIELADERDAAIDRAADAEAVRDTVLADRAAGGGGAVERASEAAVLAGAAAVADELRSQSAVVRRASDDLDRLVRRLHDLEPASLARELGRAPLRPATPGKARPRRTPIAIPGGLYGDSLAAAEFVVRHPAAVVIVDGYNVAKLRFPRLALEDQRERTIDLCEDLAKRWGTNVVVVFDGANASGIAGTTRRLVRVTYSPEGVIADDTIRAEVAALADDVAVVVVTNDQAVIADVRAAGANPVSSDRFLELAAR